MLDRLFGGFSLDGRPRREGRDWTKVWPWYEPIKPPAPRACDQARNLGEMIRPGFDVEPAPEPRFNEKLTEIDRSMDRFNNPHGFKPGDRVTMTASGNSFIIVKMDEECDLLLKGHEHFGYRPNESYEPYREPTGATIQQLR